MQKKGLSAIVATVLLIMIVIFLIMLMWMFVLPQIKKISDINDGCRLADISIDTTQGYTCYDEQNKTLAVQVTKGNQEATSSFLKFYVTSQGNSILLNTEEFVMEKNSQKVFYLDVSNLSSVDKVKLVPVIKIGSKIQDCSYSEANEFDKCELSTNINRISPACDLTEARWNVSDVLEGTEVLMIVEGTNCNELDQINFSIYESDLWPLSDTYLESNLSNYSNGTWTAKWINEGGIDPNPEYYFIARVLVGGSEKQSGELKVTPSVCVPIWTNSTPSDLYNYSVCFENDTIIQAQNITESDSSGCNLTNTTYYNFTTIPCVNLPNSVTNLRYLDKEKTWILWGWINPSDIDFNETIIYVNGVWRTTLPRSVNTFNATGLIQDSFNTIKIHTKDERGNINYTDVTNTVLTDFDVNACTRRDSTGIGSGIFFNGSGSLASPYGICNCQMLQEINNYKTANFSLLVDTDCSETRTWNPIGGNPRGFTPIGNCGTTDCLYITSPLSFNGSLEGNNNQISNIYIFRPATYGVGLFGYLGPTGKVSNVNLININISGYYNVNAIAGFNQGTITNSFYTGNVTSLESFGSLVSYWSFNRLMPPTNINYQDYLSIHNTTNNNANTDSGKISMSAYYVGQTGFEALGSRTTIDTTLDDTLSNGFTISAWVKAIDFTYQASANPAQVPTSKYRTIISNLYRTTAGSPRNGIQYYLSRDLGQPVISMWSNNQNIWWATNFFPNNNTWYYFTVTWNGTLKSNGFKLYTNGVEYPSYSDSTITLASFPSTTAWPMEIGRSVGKAPATGCSGCPTTDMPMYGDIDEMVIYNRALTPQEVAQLYSIAK